MIKWKLPGMRDRLYTAINLVKGQCTTNEHKLSAAELSAVEDILRSANFPLPPENKAGAIGMQHRWCMTTQPIKDARQVRLVMENRLAAIRVNYVSMYFTTASFINNGFDESIRGFLQAHKTGILTETEVISLLQNREAHPPF